MDDKKPEDYRVGNSYLFFDVAIPSPPGKKFRGKHLVPGEDPYAINRRWWLVTVGAAVVALGVGALLGRFLLP
jgi:hypothetical protein